MKEAPEKIYVHVRANKELGTTWHGKKITNSDIEYTRTDAFVEKACEWLSNMPLEDMDYKYDGFDTSEGWYRMIEDFRNYMEK